MDKPHQNHFASAIIKRQGSPSGSLRVFDWREGGDNDPFLTLFIEIETSDKENEKIITTLAETLADQFFNAPTETVEFAFESALAKANIAIKDALLIKPKSWLNKIHVLVAGGREQELHLSAVGRAHAFLAHRDQIVDVVAGQNDAPRERALNSLRTPNPVKLFSNIVSGRLLGQDALVICNEAVLDYLSPERIRKTAQEFEPAAAVAKFEELLDAAPANKQFGLAIVKRVMAKAALAEKIAAAQAATNENAAAETAVEKYLKPAHPRQIERKPSAAMNKIMVKSAVLGKSALKTTAHYSQIGLAATLNGLSKLLDIVQNKLSAAGPRIGRAPKFIFTLWKDTEARAYHSSRFKNQWQNRWQTIQKYFSSLSARQKRVLLATAALAFIFIASIAWRAYGQETAENKIIQQNNFETVSQKIDQAEASLIYRDEARSRELLGEINALLAAADPSANRARYEDFTAKAANIQNTLDKKQVLQNLTPYLSLPFSGDGQNGLIKLGTDYYAYDQTSRQISKLNFAAATVESLAPTGDIRPFTAAVAYDNNHIALIGANTLDLINVKTGAVTAKSLTTSEQAIRGWATYARNLYALAPGANTIIRYKENELMKPQPWLKEPMDLSTASDIAVDGQINVLTDSAVVILEGGRPSYSLNLSLSEKLGASSRFIMDANLNSLFILDGEHERLLHFSKKGDLYNQYLSPNLKDATAIMASPDEKYVYVLKADKIFRVEILPPA